jgi:hypothetical protein
MAEEGEKEYVLIMKQPDGTAKAAVGGDTEDAVPSPTASSCDSEALASEENEEKNGRELARSSSHESLVDALFELGDAAAPVPFLPALDASTQITIHDGYAEAIVEAQQALDTRLLAYSQYLNIVCRDSSSDAVISLVSSIVLTVVLLCMARPVTMTCCLRPGALSLVASTCRVSQSLAIVP